MKYILLCQGSYFLITGLLPIIDIDSFMLVTGPKNDLWLVKIMGGILSAVAITFIVDAFKRSTSRSVIVLALASSFVLAYADIHYVYNNVIRRIYLADALLEIVFIILIAFVLLKEKRSLQE
ncbi:MAG: hypothetical protein ACT4ON_16740 [Bacteroidota bacterium]